MTQRDSSRPSEKIYELAICFSRMWGVAETLEPIPNLKFPQIRDMVIGWAREYVEEKEEDMVVFFVRKKEESCQKIMEV